MKLEHLSASDALKPGTPVWIIPDLKHSRWAQRIDWYLNFQVNRATPHRTPAPDPALVSVMEKWEFEPQVIELQPNSPLIVASSDKLPNEMTVEVPFDGDASAWTARCHQIWEGLQRPSLRLFLPTGLNYDGFRSLWPQKSGDVRITAVEDTSFDLAR